MSLRLPDLGSVGFAPIVPTPVLLVAGVALAAALVALVASTRRCRVGTTVRLVLAAAAVLGIALGPSTGQARVVATLTNLDVVFVVDTTPSAAAQDFDGTHIRLSGMRADVLAVAHALPGSQYELVTFNSDTEVVMPLTSDASALSAAMSVIHPQTVDVATGSSIDEPVPTLRTMLTGYRHSRPGRSLVLVYLSDGEQTVAHPPRSFAAMAPLVDGGAVLGYGTAHGGRMLEWEDPGSGVKASYIDGDNGSPALSRIDQADLRRIAAQVGVPYRHRVAPGGSLAALRLPPVRPAPGSGHTVSVARPLYWPLGGVLALLVMWELAAAVVAGDGGRTVRT